METGGAHAPPPANWYVDPENHDQLRYWDGSTWTTHTTPHLAPTPTEPSPDLGQSSSEVDLLSFFPESRDVPAREDIVAPVAVDAATPKNEPSVSEELPNSLLRMEASYPSISTPSVGADGTRKPPPFDRSYIRSEYAPWWRRVVGSVLDNMCLTLLFTAVILGHSPAGGVVVALVWVAYVVWAIGSPTGATIGMRLMRLRCVDDDFYLSTVGYGRSFWRQVCAALIQLAPLISLGLIGPGVLVIFSLAMSLMPLADVLWPLWDDKHQTLHDKMASTVVLYEPNGRPDD